MNIKELRKQTGWTQMKFCEYFGIPRRTLQSWELEERHCPEYLLDLIEYKLIRENIITKEG